MRLLLPIILASVMAAAPAHADIAPPRPDFEVVEGRLILPDHTQFVFKPNSDELEPRSLRAAYRVADFLKAKAAIKTLRIEVHVAVAEAGTAEAAQSLSERRALVVAKAIAARDGACARLLPLGFGAQSSVVPRDNPANTRVEVRIAAARGRSEGDKSVVKSGKVAGDPCAK